MEKMRGSAGRWAGRVAAVAAALTLAACGGGGGGGSADGGTGTLRMAMMDAPSCYRHVWVTVAKVRIHTSGAAGEGEGGWREIVLPTPKRIDLLGLTNGIIEELGSTQLPAGSYSQVRLVLVDNRQSDEANPANAPNAVQLLNGDIKDLKTPSAQQSGLKLQVHFTVQDGQTLDLVADFDACKSIVVAGRSGNYILKPVISITPMVSTSIQGYVTSTMTVGTAVSAQQNGTVVRSTVPDADGKFVLAYLPQGTYDVVITSGNRATGVISSVPVGTTTTTVSGTATAIVLPTSTMSTVSGTVTMTPAPIVATVTAFQALSSGSIQVKSTNADFELGTYTLSLPVQPPVRAPYAAGALTFNADGTGGTYRLDAASPGRSTQTQPVDIRTAPATANFAF